MIWNVRYDFFFIVLHCNEAIVEIISVISKVVDYFTLL